MARSFTILVFVFLSAAVGCSDEDDGTASSGGDYGVGGAANGGCGIDAAELSQELVDKMEDCGSGLNSNLDQVEAQCTNGCAILDYQQDCALEDDCTALASCISGQPACVPQ